MISSPKKRSVPLRNETRTYRFLKQLFPKEKIVRQYRIDEKVYDDTGKIIKWFIKPDFYMKKDGVEYIIEYNGKQHYEPGKRYGNKAFARQQIRDAWLRTYCEGRDIKLFEIDGRKITGDRIKRELMTYFGIEGKPVKRAKRKAAR